MTYMYAALVSFLRSSFVVDMLSCTCALLAMMSYILSALGMFLEFFSIHVRQSAMRAGIFCINLECSSVCFLTSFVSLIIWVNPLNPLIPCHGGSVFPLNPLFPLFSVWWFVEVG